MSDANNARNTARLFALGVFVPFGAAYLISYALRTVNAAISPQLTREFGLDAAALGLLTAAYFLSFAFTQLPLGAWLDRYRPRRVESVLLLSCALGCFIFASANTSTGLIVGRAFIGAGVAACLMATIRTFGLWLPPERLPAMNGYMLAVGNAGAIASTAPALWLLQSVSWQQMFVGIGAITLMLAAVLAFLVPDPPVADDKAAANKGATAAPAGWGAVIKHPLFWAVAPITCFSNAVGLSVQGLWAGPWLVDVANMPPSQIGSYLLLISAGMLVANIAMGKVMTALIVRGVSGPWFASVCCIAALLGQLPFLFSWSASPALVMIAFGLTHVAGNLVFAALFPMFPAEVRGRLSTTLNFLMFGLGFLLQWCIGLVVNRFPSGAVGRYLPQGYESAFIIMAVIQIAIIAWTFVALNKAAPRKIKSMNIALRILEIVLPVLAIIAFGYFIGRRWKPDMRVVNRLNLDVFGPFLVLAYLSDKGVDLVSLWPLVVASVVIVLGSGILAWPFAKLSGQNPRTFVPPMMFNNCGNMGLPLALFAFGAPGVAGMVALFTTSNLLHFTIGSFIVNKHADLKVLLKSPMVWATIIGASLGLSGLHLPDSVHAPLKMIGDCTIPVMLLSLGVRMLDVKREDFTNSLLGAAVCPLTGLLVAGLLAVWLPMSKTQIGLVYLFGSLPPAVLNFLVADYYKQEPEKVASIVLVGNIASIVFIPFGLWFALR